MNSRTLNQLPAALAIALALGLASSSLRAEPTAPQRAAAEALFHRGTELMNSEQYAEACEKFQASQKLDPAPGTMLYLADCYDRAGRTASAWALFQEAAQRARLSDQPDRERIAKERAADLHGRLSLLEIRVPESHRISGLELSLGGVSVPLGSLNVPLPVDPGTTRVELRAPEKKPWSVEITIPPGPITRVLDVPVLQDLPRTADAPSNEPARSMPPAPSSGRSNTQATLGYVTGATGLAALVIGGLFGYQAHEQNRQSTAECRASDPNACTPRGVELRQNAKEWANLSTIVTTGGAALVAGSLVILITAPSMPPGQTDNRSATRRARPSSPESVVLKWGGVF